MTGWTFWLPLNSKRKRDLLMDQVALRAPIWDTLIPSVRVSSRSDCLPHPSWSRRLGHPRGKWINQFRNDNSQTPANLWRRALGCGHHGQAVQQPTLAMWWWWWWWWDCQFPRPRMASDNSFRRTSFHIIEWWTQLVLSVCKVSEVLWHFITCNLM